VTVHTGLLRLETEGEGQIVDLTEGVLAVVRQSEVVQGLVCVFVTGSTAAVTTMEYEPGGVQDLREALERLVPRARPGGGDYAPGGAPPHTGASQPVTPESDGDDNAHSHLRASLLGPSETVPLVGGRLVLGTWQQLVLIDFDDRPRRREVHVQIAS
jgi:secondary thiamine-phosphate synthase enzyme